ncbi:MAG: TIGR01777 family oxidoreductase [Fibrobacterota bacterium]
MGRIAIAGSTGLLGTALRVRLSEQGNQVSRLVRKSSGKPDEIVWNPGTGQIPPSSLAACDAVVNLAGEPISKRWTHSVRRRILDSRVDTTAVLAQACVRDGVPVLVNASATGIYGDRDDEILDEKSPSGGGFLADVCVAWEHALRTARESGVRTASVRFGMILSETGGALPRMRPAFKAGLGGRLGSGRQWMPWIHLEDAVSAVIHTMGCPTISGPVLATSPTPLRQSEFADLLATSLGRKARAHVPAWVLRVALGAMADELLLCSQRCIPVRLKETGFVWAFPDPETALARTR